MYQFITKTLVYVVLFGVLIPLWDVKVPPLRLALGGAIISIAVNIIQSLEGGW
jgi:hypothetical protein